MNLEDKYDIIIEMALWSFAQYMTNAYSDILFENRNNKELYTLKIGMIFLHSVQQGPVKTRDLHMKDVKVMTEAFGRDDYLEIQVGVLNKLGWVRLPVGPSEVSRTVFQLVHPTNENDKIDLELIQRQVETKLQTDKMLLECVWESTPVTSFLNVLKEVLKEVIVSPGLKESIDTITKTTTNPIRTQSF